MTLLSICQQVANDLGLSVPTSIVNNTDQTAARLLAQAQKAGQSLARKPQGGWVAMIQEYDFTTAALAAQTGAIANTGPNGAAVISGLSTTAGITAPYWYGFGTGVPKNSIVQAVTSSTVTLNQPASQTGPGTFNFGQSDYPLPPTFQRPVDGTMWDRSRYWQMRGPQSPQQWQVYKSSVIGQASVQRRFRFRQPILVGGDAGPLRFSIDPVPTDNGSPLVMEYVSNGWCQSEAGVPQALWEADTDLGILDENLITLGVTWRMLRRLGLSYNEELSEYETEVGKAMAVDGGAAILSIVPSTYSFLLSPANIQEASFPGPGM
jgi:hypothetical protein